jgi:hypothetical protein
MWLLAGEKFAHRQRDWLGVRCQREVPVEAASNFRSLRSRGITVRKTIDTLKLVPQRGFEPLTHALRMRCSTN